eukprot:14630_1
MSAQNSPPMLPIKTKERKERIIKNGIVEIDDVSVAPGIDYRHWTKIARIKLRERELILLQKRQEACNQIINAAIQQFTSHCIQRFQTHNVGIPIYKMERDNLSLYLQYTKHKVTALNSNIMRRCRQSITGLLVAWDGYKPKTEVRSFRKYFQQSRRWFDQKKVQMLGAHFFGPIMAIAEEYTTTVAAQFFEYRQLPLQKLYSDHLNLLILNGLLEGKIDPSNTRSMWLVPASVYPKNESNLTGKDLRDEYLKLVRFKSKTARKVFEDELLRFYMDSRWDVVHNPMTNHNSNSFSHAPATNPSINCYQTPRFPHRNANVSCAMSNPPVSTWTNNNNYIANPPVMASFINATPCVQEQTQHRMAPVQPFGYQCIRSGYKYNHNSYRAPYTCVFDIDANKNKRRIVYPPFQH